MKPFLSFSRDPETPPHLEPEVDALVRRHGPLTVGPAGLPRLCPDLPSSCSAQEAASSSPGRAWGGAPQGLLCLHSALSMMTAGIMLGGRAGKQWGAGGGGRAGVTMFVPAPGRPRLQTSASPRSYTPTSSAWASVCLCAGVSCSSGRGWWASGCREVPLGAALASLGAGGLVASASGSASLGVEGPW